MIESEVLFTIAEVAVAFAGFASLVGVLGQRSSRDDPRVLGARMRGIILFSLLAVAFSLLPFILHRYGLDEASVWRLSSVLFLVSFSAVGFWIARAVTRLIRLDVPSRPVSPLIAAILFASMTTGTILLALNTVFVPPHLMPAVYLTSLGVCLFLAGLPFTAIVFSFLPGSDSD